MRTRSTTSGVRACTRFSRGQEGSILILVLAVVLMLSIGVVGMLNMSLNTDSIAVTMRGSTEAVHKVDGALEAATNVVRNDPALCGGIVPVTPQGAYNVECVQTSTSTGPANPHRTVDLIASPDGTPGVVVGKARVRFTDYENGAEVAGYSVEVCDWLLIQAVTNGLRGCS